MKKLHSFLQRNSEVVATDSRTNGGKSWTTVKATF